jgi:hypothetical protein
MNRFNIINTDRGMMCANDDGSIFEEYSDYSVIHINYNFIVVDRNGEKVESTCDKTGIFFYIAEQGNKFVELVKRGEHPDLALNKLDTEGLVGALKLAGDCGEPEHIPEIGERLNQLPNKLLARVNDPLKAKEKQIAGVKKTAGMHRPKSVVKAINTVKLIAEESLTTKVEAKIRRSAGLGKKEVQRAKKIAQKVSDVRKFWHKFRETMPYDEMLRIIADKTGAHPTNVEDWVSEFEANNSDYLF